MSRLPRARFVASSVVSAALAVALSSGCGVDVQGSFGDVPWAPVGSTLAVLDANDILDVDGAQVPVERPRPQRGVHLLLTSASIDTGANWSTWPIERLLETRHALAVHDALSLHDVDFDTLGDGGTLRATWDGERVQGDFDFAVVHAAPGNTASLEAVGNGLGGLVTVTIDNGVVEDTRRGGTTSFHVTVERQRRAGQPEGDLATGEVQLSVSTSLSRERLAESNLAIAAPVLRCAMRAGPVDAGACIDVASDAIVDDTGVVHP